MNNSRTGQRIRVLVADDHPIVRSGIVFELERHPDIDVVASTADGIETMQRVNALCPDVLVLDINMPNMNGVELLRQLQESPDPKPDLERWPPCTLILSAHCEAEYVYELFAVGAKGYLLKDELPARIVEGVRSVFRGDPALSLQVQKTLLRRRQQPQHDLSSRELEVIRLIAKGFTNEEIAESLVIAEGTVKNHVTNIYRKLDNVRTRSEAVAWAWENRIVQAD